MRPVERVSWNDCQEFIFKLNEITGRAFRLPTEAEWEYAARGGKRSKGYKYAGSNIIDAVAWCWDNIPSHSYDSAGYGTQIVASKFPNELGLYDMSGNVCEWCQDWFGSYNSFINKTQINPTGPTTGLDHVLRGGGWGYNTSGCRVSYRFIYVTWDIAGYLGLRLVL